MIRFSVICATVISLMIGSSAMAAKLTGKVTVTSQFREALAEQEKESELGLMRGYWNEPNGLKQVALPEVDPSSDLGVVVFRDGAPPPKADEIKTVNVLAGSMAQNVVVVRPNSRVKFVMQDPFDHELYSPGLDSFAPQKQAQRSFRPVDFAKEGAFEVRCKLMPHFRGWVVVSAAAYVPDVSADGSFTLEDLEEGDYTVRVFHDGKWVASKKFKVEKKQREVQVALKLEELASVDDSDAGKPDKKQTDAEAGKEKQEKAKGKDD